MSAETTTVSSSPVTVAWYMHPIEAAIARGKLESEGIPAFLHSSNHSHLDWPITLALGGIRLQVPPSAAQEAMEVLSSVEAIEDQQGEIGCEVCGSEETETDKTSWRLAFLVFHLVGIPLPFSTAKRRCRSCGTRWVDD